MAHSNSINLIALSEINEQLFSEVSPEQAAIVEGGLRVQLLSLRCLAAGGGSDQVFATFNGVRGSLTQSMVKGSVANFGDAGGSSSRVKVRFFDESNGNAFVGGFNADARVSQGNPRSVIIVGNGSRYQVTYIEKF